MEKLQIDRPIIVEGKYDKITLSSVLEANIIPLGGFSIFHHKDKMALIRRLGERNGIIVLTDSDGAGQLLRSHLSSTLPRDQITHLYIPQIPGKEKRKSAPSKEGYLGVEGMEAARIREIFAPFATNGSVQRPTGRLVEKRDLYADGLSGGPGAAARREALAKQLDLPAHLSAGALLEAINLLYRYDAYKEALLALPPLT